MTGLLRVKSPVLAFVGLVVVGLVALQLVQGQITVTAAATRVVIVTVCLAVVDMFVLPLARTLISVGHRPQD
jgi:hypothetical protein